MAKSAEAIKVLILLASSFAALVLSVRLVKADSAADLLRERIRSSLLIQEQLTAESGEATRATFTSLPYLGEIIPNDWIVSPSASFMAAVQGGNLVVMSKLGQMVWSTNIPFANGYKLSITFTGNLILARFDKSIIWSTQTSMVGNVSLELGDDGALRLVSPTRGLVWSSGLNEVTSPCEYPRTFILQTFMSRFYAIFQLDSNFVVYDPSGMIVWATNTAGSGATRLSLRNTGELTLMLSNGTIVWSSGTTGHSTVAMSMTNEGFLRVVSKTNGAVAWLSTTNFVSSTHFQPFVFTIDTVLSSVNRVYVTKFVNSNLYVFQNRSIAGGIKWSSLPESSTATSLRIETNGQMLMRSSAGAIVWRTPFIVGGPATLRLLDNGALVLYANLNNNAIWSSRVLDFNAPSPSPPTAFTAATLAPVTSAPTRSEDKCIVFDQNYFGGVAVPQHLEFAYPVDLFSKSLSTQTFSIANVKNLVTAEKQLMFGVNVLLAKYNGPKWVSLVIQAVLIVFDLILLAVPKLYGAASGIPQQKCFFTAGAGLYDQPMRDMLIHEPELRMGLDSNLTYAMMFFRVPLSFFGCAPTSTCQLDTDFATVAAAVSLCPQAFHMYINSQTMACLSGSSNLEAGVGIDVGFSPDATIKLSATLFDFDVAAIRTYRNIPFHFKVGAYIETPLVPNKILGRLLKLACTVTLAIFEPLTASGQVLTKRPAEIFDIALGGTTGFMVLLQGTSSFQFCLDAVTASLLPRIVVPLQQVNVILNGADRPVVGGIIKRGFHFYFGPAQTQQNAFGNFFQTLLLRLKSIAGSALDLSSIGIMKGFDVASQILDRVLTDVMNLVNIQTPVIGFYNGFGDATSMSLSHYINLAIGPFVIKGNIGLSCIFGGSSSIACKMLIPGLSGPFEQIVSIIRDAEGWIVTQGGKILFAALDAVVRAANNVAAFTTKAYQAATQAVAEGRAKMDRLFADAEAMGRGLFSCGSRFTELKLDCDFQDKFTWPRFSSNPLDWPGEIDNFKDVFTNIGKAVEMVGTCVSSAATSTFGQTARFLKCDSSDTCVKEICIPTLTFKGSNCCCGAMIGGSCWAARGDLCCGISANSCGYKLCIWKQVNLKCTTPLSCL